MLDKNTVTDLVKNIFTSKGYITEEDSKSYSHKPHLASLPYDRRSTNFDELSERYTACMDEFYKHQENVKNLKEGLNQHLDQLEKYEKELNDSLDKLAQWNEDNQKFFDADDKVLAEKKRVLESIKDRYNFDVVLPDGIVKRINFLERVLSNSSWVNDSNKEKYFYQLANDISEWRYGIEQDDTQWGKTVDGIAEDIYMLGSNDFFDKNLPSLYDNAHTVGEIAGLQDHINTVEHDVTVMKDTTLTIENEITKEDRLRNDFQDEADKITDRCWKLDLI